VVALAADEEDDVCVVRFCMKGDGKGRGKEGRSSHASSLARRGGEDGSRGPWRAARAESRGEGAFHGRILVLLIGDSF
jgi:hypothetical protein